jgi:hypothetical protein
MVNRIGTIKGRGAEDKLLNTTNNVHSLAVMENIYSTDRLISDSEPNPNVFVMEAYDYNTRNPSEDTYWDEGLKVDLQDNGEGCNVSYASIPLIGERMLREWGNSGSAEFPIMSNRGPILGELIDHSITYDIHGGGRTWVGNVCWQDNHITYEETIYPLMSVYQKGGCNIPDNLFFNDCDPCPPNLCHLWGGDTWLVLVSDLSPAGDMFPYMLTPVLEWDDE